MKKALVCGGSGFIGHHLVNRLKQEGYFVVVADIQPIFYNTDCNESFHVDLRNFDDCKMILTQGYDEVYQLAADMGGMGFISSHENECLIHNVLINANMARAVLQSKVDRVFYASSVCVYPDMALGDGEIEEFEAYPPEPDNEYGWEKLYSERIWESLERNSKIPVRIARFENTYGPEGTWEGGREKAPAALCRKVAEASEKDGVIEVWGDGSAVRVYTYIDDLVDGIRVLMDSDLHGPVNIGDDKRISVDGLIDVIETVSGKHVTRKYVDGPVGVISRNFSKATIKSLGWVAKTGIHEGIAETFDWINRQVSLRRVEV